MMNKKPRNLNTLIYIFSWSVYCSMTLHITGRSINSNLWVKTMVQMFIEKVSLVLKIKKEIQKQNNKDILVSVCKQVYTNRTASILRRRSWINYLNSIHLHKWNKLLTYNIIIYFKKNAQDISHNIVKGTLLESITLLTGPLFATKISYIQNINDCT